MRMLKWVGIMLLCIAVAAIMSIAIPSTGIFLSKVSSGEPVGESAVATVELVAGALCGERAVFTGTSDRGDLQEALAAAVAEAVGSLGRPEGGPAVGWRVVFARGARGGPDGLNRVTVGVALDRVVGDGR